MMDKRIGPLYIWNRLMDEWALNSLVNQFMGQHTWQGWKYGEMLKILLSYHLLKGEGTFPDFLQEYAAVELLEKEEWDFEIQHLGGLFRPYWGKILEHISELCLGQSNEEIREWVKVDSVHGLLVSPSGGFPVGCTGNRMPKHTFIVKRTGSEDSVPFITYKSLSEEEWKQVSDDSSIPDRGKTGCFHIEKKIDDIRHIYIY